MIAPQLRKALARAAIPPRPVRACLAVEEGREVRFEIFEVDGTREHRINSRRVDRRTFAARLARLAVVREEV